MAEFKYTFNLDTTASGDGAEKTKAGIDAVAASSSLAADTQVEAFKKTELGAQDVKNTFLELVEINQRYYDALESGNQDEAIAALQDFRVKMEDLKAITSEVPEELEKFNDKLDELDKKVRGKKSFEKLSDQANGTSKSLKRIEKLQVAEAIGNIVSQARSAGKSFADLGKEGESATDTALNAAGAVGDLASGVAAGFAAGGPIGAGIALVTAGLSYFSEQAKQAAKDIEEITDNLGTGFEQSQKSIEDAVAEVEEFEKGIQRATDLLDEQNRKLQAGLDIQMKRAEIKARAEKDEIALDRLKIEGDKKYQDDPAAKAAALAKLDEREIAVEEDLKRKQIQTEIDKQNAKIEQLRKAVKLAQEEDDKSSADAVAADRNKGTADFLKRDSGEQRGIANDQTKKLLEAIKAGTGFFDALSADELEDPLHDAIKDFKKFKVDPESKTKDLDKIDAQISFIKEVEKIISLPQVNQKDSDVVAANIAISKALSSAKSAKKSALQANEIKKDILSKNKKRKVASEKLKAAKKNLNENDDKILGNKKGLDLELEDVDRSERKRLEKSKQKRINATNKREAQEAAREEKKRKREADKKQKAIDKKEAKAGKSVGTALDTVRGLPLTGKKFKKRVNEAINANADGADNSEMEEVLAIIREAAASGKASGAVGAAMRAELGRLHGAIKANNKTLNQQVQDLAKFKQLYLNNRRK